MSHTSFIVLSGQKDRSMHVSYTNFVRKKSAIFQLTFNEKLGKNNTFYMYVPHLELPVHILHRIPGTWTAPLMSFLHDIQ